MKSVRVLSKKVLCDNPDSPFLYFGWPTVTRLPDGTLAAVASGFRLQHVCPFGKGVICYSRDEGQSWSAPAVVMDTPLDDRDCGIVPFGRGRVILTSFTNTPAFQRARNRDALKSPDAVARAKAKFIEAYLDYIEARGDFARYVGATYRVSEDGGCTFGDVKTAPITSPHGPCALRDGSLLWVGRRFSADDSFDDGAAPYLQAWRLNERDEWEPLSSIENIEDEHGLLLSCEPHTIQLPDGRLIVHIRAQRSGDRREFTLYQSESQDGGRSFTTPRRLLGHLGGSPAHLLLHSGGTLLSAYGYREAPFGVRAMFSMDAGKTWDTDWIIDAQGQSGDLGYPATVERRDGTLLTVYYENRDGRSRIMQIIWELPQ